MQANIHPEYRPVTFSCSCGNQFVVGSAIAGQTVVNLDICSNCHPFYTGQQKMIDTAGRVDRFRRRYAQGAKSGS